MNRSTFILRGLVATTLLAGCGGTPSESTSSTGEAAMPAPAPGPIFLPNPPATAAVTEADFVDLGAGMIAIETLGKRDLPDGGSVSYDSLVSQEVGDLRDAFDKQWALQRSDACTQFQNQNRVAVGQLVRLHVVVDPPVLKGRMSKTNPLLMKNNELVLRYEINGAGFSFGAANAITPTDADPRIRMSFDMYIEEAIGFADNIDASLKPSGSSLQAPGLPSDDPYVTGPAVPISQSIHFRNAHATCTGVACIKVPDQRLRDGEGTLNASVVYMTPPSLTDVNTGLRKAAAAVLLGVRNDDPGTSSFFILDESFGPSESDPNHPSFIIGFEHDGSSPARPPSNCALSVVCNDQVFGGCTDSGGGSSIMQKLEGPDPTNDNDWITVSSLNQPAMEDQQPDGSNSATYRFCSINQWGGTCGDPLPPVALPHRVCPPPPVYGPRCGLPPLPRCPKTNANN